MRTFAALIMAGSLLALPALGAPPMTKTHSNTNPAGSNSSVMTRSNGTMSRTMTNTEGHKTLSSSRTMTHATRTSKAKSPLHANAHANSHAKSHTKKY